MNEEFYEDLKIYTDCFDGRETITLYYGNTITIA